MKVRVHNRRQVYLKRWSCSIFIRRVDSEISKKVIEREESSHTQKAKLIEAPVLLSQLFIFNSCEKKMFVISILLFLADERWIKTDQIDIL